MKQGVEKTEKKTKKHSLKKKVEKDEATAPLSEEPQQPEVPVAEEPTEEPQAANKTKKRSDRKRSKSRKTETDDVKIETKDETKKQSDPINSSILTKKGYSIVKKSLKDGYYVPYEILTDINCD